MLGKKIPLLVLLACLVGQSELRANVYPSQPVRLEQPDGTALTVRFHGDEFLWWAETTDGYTIAKNPRDGWWYYAVRDAQGRLVPTEFRVGKTVPTDLPLQPHLTPRVEVIDRADAERTAFNAAIQAARTTGNLTLGVILIEFPDEPGGSYDDQQYWNLFFGYAFCEPAGEGASRVDVGDVLVGRFSRCRRGEEDWCVQWNMESPVSIRRWLDGDGLRWVGVVP